VLAARTADMGFDSLAGAQVQTVLDQDPFSGHFFCFRGPAAATCCCDGTATGCACLPLGGSEGRFVLSRAEEARWVLTRGAARRARLAGTLADVAAGASPVIPVRRRRPQQIDKLS
jgi:hypothetical protein